MKKLTLLLLCIANIAFSQEKPNSDMFKMNLNGKVKTIKQKVGVDVEINFNTDSFITEIIQSSDDRIIQKETNTYDIKNNKIENLVVSSTGKIKIISKYDAKNFKITDSIFDNSEKWTKIYKYKNDQNGIVLVKYEKVKGRKKVLMYNKYGTLITKKITKEETDYIEEFPTNNPPDITFKYQYDNKDNWIVKETYSNEKLKSTFIRTIIYY